MQEARVQSLGLEDPLEKGIATHSSILTWRTPWTEEPGGLQSMELKSQTHLSNILLTLTPHSQQLTMEQAWFPCPR